MRTRFIAYLALFTSSITFGSGLLVFLYMKSPAFENQLLGQVMKHIDWIVEDEFKRIETVLMGDDFPWFYNPGIISLEDEQGRFMFTHQLHDNRHGSSSFFPLVEPLLERLKVKHSLWRVKANLTTQTKKPYQADYHEDLDIFTEAGLSYKTAIYYVNTNNGYTKFENGGKVECVRNRLVIFDGKERHTSVSCTDEKRKIVINFNFN